MGQKLRKLGTYLAGMGQGMLAARKWLLAYFILILLPASLFMISYYQRSSRILEEEVTATMGQTLKQAALNLNYKLEHVADTSNSIFMNPLLYDNLSRENTVGQQLDQLKRLRGLSELAQENPDIVRMRIFVDNSRLYAGEGVNLFSMDRLRSYPWFQEVVDAGGGLVWTGVYVENYYDEGEKHVFSVARLLRNPERFDEIFGVLVLDVTENLMGDLLQDLQLSSVYKPYITGPGNTLVFGKIPSGELLSADQYKQAEMGDTGIFRRDIGGVEAYVIYSTIGSTGWKLVAQVSHEEISHRAAAQTQFTSAVTLVFITVLFLILTFFLLTFAVQGTRKRVQTIISMIRKEGIGWLEERRAHPVGDFRLLERSVDHLIHRMNGIMEESYQMKVKEREAELRALQAQINPHFLYNALDMINWSAIAHGAEDTSEMIEALALYFRLSLNKGKDHVSIADELNLARVYLEIQMNRFPSTFTFQIEQEPGLEGCMIPKLTLQPIVENALLHGIRRSKEKKGTILIKAARDGGDLILMVRDDGIGMEEETARRLLLEPPPEVKADGSGSSYGLYNVNERIRIFSGGASGLSIETAPHKGTLVTVRLKDMWMKEEGSGLLPSASLTTDQKK